MWRHGINVRGFGGDTIHMYIFLDLPTMSDHESILLMFVSI